MDKGVPVGTSLLPPGSTTLWKESAISRWRHCPPAQGGATRPRWKTRTVILHTQDGGRLARPVQLVIPLEVDQSGEDMEDDKL
jgi:hypothetical protein